MGHGAASNHVTPSSSNIVASGSSIHPYMSRSQHAYQSYNYGYIAPHLQRIPNYHIPLHPFMGHTRGGYYPTDQGHGIYYNQPYVNQPF